MTETIQKLGKLVIGAESRDAIHIAVYPVVAAERLSPGEHVGILGTKVGRSDTPIGVVDPFLKAPVFEGDGFWLFLYPGSITSLLHVWIHPAIDGDEHVQWLKGFAVEAGISYEELLSAAKDYVDHEEYLIQGGRWEGFNTPDEFWPHYEAVTGEKVEESRRGSFFSCSC